MMTSRTDNRPSRVQVTKIISGGQTGADIAGLDWAIAHGLSHGGWCPAGRPNEAGTIAPIYELQETQSSGYLARNRQNVLDSDATLIFSLASDLDGGSRRTALYASKFAKPWMHIHPATEIEQVLGFLSRHNVRVLNVAGKRESVAPGIHAFTTSVLDAVLTSP